MTTVFGLSNAIIVQPVLLQVLSNFIDSWDKFKKNSSTEENTTANDGTKKGQNNREFQETEL